MSKNNNLIIKVNLEAEEAIKKLEKIKQLLKEIKETMEIEIGIDFGQEKDYTTTQTYMNEKLIKEETIYYK